MSHDRHSMPPRARIAVAICAHNEAPYLADCVASVMRQTLSPHYEVVVIDNGSTDSTPALLADLQRLYGGRLAVCREDHLGLSHARNRALREASAPLVAFLDADAVADPGWLEGVLEAFSHSDRVGAVGGPVRVQWDHPRPRWWSAPLDEALNAFEPGDEPMRLSYPHYPYGTNFAVRVRAMGGVEGFAAALGRRGASLGAAEDGEACLRLERAGWEIRLAPSAVVHHRTPPARLRRRYVLRRAFHHGRSQRLLEAMHAFESGRYLSWQRLASTFLARMLRLRVDLPFLKFFLFRAGYHWQRTFGRREALVVHPSRLHGAGETPAPQCTLAMSEAP
jgi:GT2 family glycosyltransferase